MNLSRTITASLILAFITTLGPAKAQEVSETGDKAWISLSGKVGSVSPTGFTLDYGEDDITVELDKFDWPVEKSRLNGQQVTVTGRIDKTLRDRRTIEAALVFVPGLNEYIQANPMDEETEPAMSRRFAPALFGNPQTGNLVSFSGRVTGIEGDIVTVDTGVSRLRVDTSGTPEGAAPSSVEVDDRILVTGEMSMADFLENREVDANAITRLTGFGE